ncbi:hypothetical protein [Christensenella intestinihominis]|uniref:hypothetical protein n=1 Tax=Christensenella intestinihominis TaxID=1851429 RepID=UPI0008378500|nr:hypothetical protein [Christensenella intestinihominis]
MLGCNDNVTVWNRWRNPETGKDEWFRHILPVKCKWKTHVNRDVSGGTANIANSLVLVVPYSELYRKPQVWAALNAEDRKKFFTLQGGDLAALDIQTAEITGTKPNTEAEIKKSLLPDVMTIKAVPDNTRSAHGKHIRVEGV